MLLNGPGLGKIFNNYNLLLFLLSFLICIALTPVVRWYTKKRGLIAVPTDDRWHKNSTATMGGIAIYISIIIPLFLLADFKSAVYSLRFYNEIPYILVVLIIGITFLFILGIFDDFFNIKAHNKLVVQIIIAAIVAFLGFRLEWFQSLTVDTLITIVWIVGITNAFNLLDNMDGLCAGIGFISAIFFFIICTQSGGNLEYAYISSILAGSLMAFLFYNFHPASIFMGDSGSLIIGFTLSLLSLNPLLKESHNVVAFLAVPVLVLLVPIIDTSMVTIIRKLSKRKASVGGRDHFSHRLVFMGFGEKGAVLFLYSIAVMSGLTALFVYFEVFPSTIDVIPFLIALILLIIHLSRLRVYPEGEFTVLKDARFTPILFNLTYKRQIFAVALDLILISFSYYISYKLRFGEQYIQFFRIFLLSLPIIIACKFLAFFIVGVYRGIASYISTPDTYVIIRANILGSIMAFAGVMFFYRLEYLSKGVFIIDFLLLTSLVLASRASFRGFSEINKRKTIKGENVIIYGAGRGGELLLREILNNHSLNVKPIGLIDDDPFKIGKTLQGYPIIGTSRDIEKICKKNNISGIIVSSRQIDTNHFKNVTSFCKERGLSIKRFDMALVDL